MVFPWMFDEFSALAPLKEAAAILAAKEDWPDRQALNANRVSICFWRFSKIRFAVCFLLIATTLLP